MRDGLKKEINGMGGVKKGNCTTIMGLEKIRTVNDERFMIRGRMVAWLLHMAIGWTSNQLFIHKLHINCWAHPICMDLRRVKAIP